MAHGGAGINAAARIAGATKHDDPAPACGDRPVLEDLLGIPFPGVLLPTHRGRRDLIIRRREGEERRGDRTGRLWTLTALDPDKKLMVD